MIDRYQGLSVFYGKSAQDGEPAPDNPVTISNVGDSGSIGVTVTGTNLLDVNAMEQLTINDKQYQGVEVQGLRPGNYYVLANNKTIRSDYIYVRVHKRDGSYTNLMYFITNVAVNDQTVTIEEGDSIVIYNASTSDNRDTTIQKFNFYQIQVNVGSKPLPWEPYKPTQTLTLTTPDGLPGIPVTSGGNITIDGQQYIADAIELYADGSGKYIKRIWKNTFDGSENWKKYTTSGLEGFYVISLPETMASRYGISNQLTPYTNGLTKNAIRFGAGDTAIYCTKNEFYDASLEDGGLSNWKAHLAQTPLEVMTYLETPIETELTPEEIQEYKELHTYYPNTTISNNDNAYMGVSYVADTKLYIDNKFGELQQSIVATQQQLL